MTTATYECKRCDQQFEIDREMTSNGGNLPRRCPDCNHFVKKLSVSLSLDNDDVNPFNEEDSGTQAFNELTGGGDDDEDEDDDDDEESDDDAGNDDAVESEDDEDGESDDDDEVVERASDSVPIEAEAEAKTDNRSVRLPKDERESRDKAMLEMRAGGATIKQVAVKFELGYPSARYILNGYSRKSVPKERIEETETEPSVEVSPDDGIDDNESGDIVDTPVIVHDVDSEEDDEVHIEQSDLVGATIE